MGGSGEIKKNAAESEGEARAGEMGNWKWMGS
jgi:hypothetical protein